jgi:hypothetical protein
MRGAARTLVALALVSGAGVALWWAGGALPLPEPDPATWGPWLDDHGPAVAALSLARLLGLVAVAYVTAVGLVVAVLRVAGWPRAARAALALAPPVLRRALAGSAGLALALPSAAWAGTAAEQPPPSPDVAVMRLIEVPAAGPPGTPPPATTAPPTTTTTTPPPTTATPPATASPEPPPPPEPAPEAVPTPVAAEHVVQAGEHLWGIARQALTTARGAPPCEAAILAYVHEIVGLNAHVLVVPGQPDLILPGQVFALPPITGEPASTTP